MGLSRLDLDQLIGWRVKTLIDKHADKVGCAYITDPDTACDRKMADLIGMSYTTYRFKKVHGSWTLPDIEKLARMMGWTDKEILSVIR